MKYNSPVVERHGVKTFLVAIHLDGIAFAKRDGVLGIFMYNMVNKGRRRLIAAVRKYQMCRCGCRGYCTSFHAFLCIRWCIETMADVTNPLSRHDGWPFWLEEVDRIAIAGMAMVSAFIVILVERDLGRVWPNVGIPDVHIKIINHAPCAELSKKT